jgi:acyl-coenzyme A synthetase/AMP-(fatty) acid ligase
LALNAGIYNVLFGLRAGAALVIMNRFETAEFAELVRRFEIRSTVLPPAAIAMLNDDPAVTDLTPLRYVRSITSPLSPLQARRFTESFGVFVLNGYGQAEIGEVIGWTAADAKAHPEKVGAVGRPHAGVSLKIVDPDGTAVAPGEVGELLVRPPNMASGYASGAELSDRIDEEGYLATGDLGRLDEDGFVWIEGRSGDLINRGGNKVFPDEVEEVLRLSPLVAEAAVVGVPDDRLGEVPVAFIVTTGDVADDELIALCRAHLTPYKIPLDFVRVDALPKNEIGKLLRRQLAAGYTR